MIHSAAGWGCGTAAPVVPGANRRNCRRNPPCSYPDRPAFPRPFCGDGLRCNAWQPAHRHPPSRSCPAHPPAGSAWRNPAPCAPSLRRQPESPCGWYLPSTSPTIRADFLKAVLERMPISCMAYRMRRWTGFRPSRASGRARATMTDMA